jgi:Cu(I)-responsive transcriptional regulator
MSSGGILRIGDLARATGTTPETIRYYEKVELLSRPSRTGGNYRSYSQDDLARLRFIRRTRDLGFSIEQVRALLVLAAQAGRDCATVDAIATEHLAEIDRKIADLSALRRELAKLIAVCAGGTVAGCRILEAFSPSSST